MLTVEHKVGRLLVVRVVAPVQLADLAPFEEQLRDAVRLAAQRRLRMVGCTDLTGATLFPPEVSEAFIDILRRDNPLLERGAFLIGPTAIFALQIERILKQGNHPMRRAFRETPALLAWLAEVLTAEEAVQLRKFLRLA